MLVYNSKSKVKTAKNEHVKKIYDENLSEK